MDETLRLLIVEDLPADAELEEHELRRAGLVFTSRRVDTESGFRAAIDEFRPHLIISDYSLPAGDGMQYLEIARRLCPGVPFIFVSGTIGEDRAVEALKQGATDYVLKDRLGSLPLRVERALQEADERRQREQLEVELRQAQKVEAIGRLAGGVAHDFNNLLTLIVSYTELSLNEVPDEAPLRQNLEQIGQAAWRASDLTRQLLAFGRRQSIVPTVLDLNAVVADTGRMLRRLIGEHIAFVARLSPDLGRLRADRGQIEQVIMNLALNARDAMTEGGTLRFDTADVHVDEASARLHVGMTPGKYVMLTVSDTGTGMDEFTRAHLFEPFFTTKAPGAGTGLGLATVYGIVTQSGGTISVESELGRGTTFTLSFPRVEDPLTPVQTVKPGRPLRGTETVLLVEDDAAIRLLARRVLEAHGYTVLETDTGTTALEMARAYADRIHLLLTDVVLPQMSGAGVAAAIEAIRPETRVLYMSGYTANTIVRHGVLTPGVQLLEKPFTPEGLLRRIRDVLDPAG